MSVSLSNSFSSHFSDSFARTVTPQLDRRAHTERRTPMTPMPVLERPWARHALAAGFVGVILGCTGAMVVLTQRATAEPVQAALTLQAESALPEAAVMAPLFDTTPFASPVLTATGNSTPGSTESYSEDAPGVPSATYQEPPSAQTAKK